MKYVIAVDLEGIGGVVGAPYDKLILGHKDYDVAVTNAVREINAAVSALFDSGAELVAVWDNHGGGNNIDFSLIDKRAIQVSDKGRPYRFDLANDHAYDGVVYLGYHAREGSFEGVLAHSYSSTDIQYCRVNGEDKGEIELDSYIAADHGIAPIFAASDKACIEQFKELSPNSVTVITKYGKSRNEATLRDEDEVVNEIYNGVKEGAKKVKEIPLPKLPMPAEVEMRYTRAERAYEKLEKISARGDIKVRFGRDTHTLLFTVNSAKEIVLLF